MAATEESMMASIASAKAGILKTQADLDASGISGAAEARVDAALTELSVIANPVVPNPPGVPADPGGTTPSVP